MKKKITWLLALSLLLGLLAGCGDSLDEGPGAGPAQTVPATTGETAPPDGNPKDVTCKGSYTGQAGTGVVARAGGQTLTGGVLQAYYWAEVEQFRREEHQQAPDFERPLDVQLCPLDDAVVTWQQYFLKRALNTWHTAQALVLQGETAPVPTEEDFKPSAEKHEEYMTDMPANQVLYGYYDHYVPNSMHQAYLDNLPATLEELAGNRGYGNAAAMADSAFGATQEDLEAFAQLYNRAYMYFTELTYRLTSEEASETGPNVNIRQILLHPKQSHNPWRPAEEVEEPEIAPDGTVTCSQALWESGMEEAEKLLNEWKSDRRMGEATFAELANQYSVDAGSAVNGGSYRNLQPGQLLPELEAWCFDPARVSGDTTIIKSSYGIHILYFSGSTDTQQAEEEAALAQQSLLEDARAAYPMEVDYSAISLKEAQSRVAYEDVLYPDVAHERYPEVPLYVQQDYPDTKYGAYPLRTHGCGITTMAMLASYMTDQQLTPPMLAKRYGSYCTERGTDGLLFNRVPAELGFYLKEKTHQPNEAKQALEEGYMVVVVQTKGFWTRGGHYLLIEKMLDDGRIQVRDSNLINYGRLEDHKNDSFDWSTIPPKCGGYWIFQNKIKTIPACTRCGEGQSTAVSPADYICEKCRPAMVRRDTYLTGASQEA